MTSSALALPSPARNRHVGEGIETLPLARSTWYEEGLFTGCACGRLFKPHCPCRLAAGTDLKVAAGLRGEPLSSPSESGQNTIGFSQLIGPLPFWLEGAVLPHRTSQPSNMPREDRSQGRDLANWLKKSMPAPLSLLLSLLPRGPTQQLCN